MGKYDSKQDDTYGWEADDPADSDETRHEEAAEALTALDEDVVSYTDEEHTDDEESPQENGKRKKSPGRADREAEFAALYQAYMHPEKPLSAYRTQCQLDDLMALLYKLNASWAYRKAKRYELAGFHGVDADMALSIGCAPIYDLLKHDKATGSDCTYPVAHYLRIAQNKSIDDYFRANFGRLPPKKKTDGSKFREPRIVSLEDMLSDPDGKFRGDRSIEASVDPFADMRRPRWERDEQSRRLSVMYLRELMNYPGEPQKPLALMYGNILYQLARESGGKDALSQSAKKSTKVSSPEWAHRKMGDRTLVQLAAESERVVRKCYESSIPWGPVFQQYMQECTADGASQRWADIVYTKTYTQGETANWIESIFKSTMLKCARKLSHDPELMEFAIETLGYKNKFRQALEKMEKEACR